MHDLQMLVDAADEAALLRAVDGLCASRQWDALVDLARRCREAIELGKQLWPVAMHIDYRLAWEGPPAHAAAVLRPGAGRFVLGPLTEVAASTHDWASLAPHIPDPASAAAVAQERVLRGETLSELPGAPPPELPLRLQPWEPSYALPTYSDREASFPQPRFLSRPQPTATPLSAAPALPDDAALRALRDTVEVWVTQSSGAVRAVSVEGAAPGAVAHLSATAALQPLTPAEALAWLQWSGASGGAYGRRRGGAAGRFSAWWAAAALTGLDWPDHQVPGGLDEFAGRLGAALDELRWFRWFGSAPESGWTLRLAVADPVDGLSWAIEATDAREDDLPDDRLS